MVLDLRKALFVHCATKEALHNWIQVYLEIDFPDTLVDPVSTSSPMDVLWEIYRKALANDDETFDRILVFAARDSFKCVAKGTPLLSREKGLASIEDLSVGDVIWSGWNWRPIREWIHDGVKESVTLALKNGATLTTSPVHRVWAWEPGALPNWKRVSDLTDRDLVEWDVGSGFSSGEVDQGEFDLGYLCGILTGDGCLRFMESQGYVTLSTVDPHILDFWKKACLRYAGREPSQSKSRPCDWRINSVPMCRFLMALGMTTGYSWEKDFPARCLWNRSVMVGFISGVFDTDGTVGSRKEICFPMTAEKLLRKLQVVLAALGVDSKFRSNRLYPEHGQKHQVHLVVVSQNEIPALLASGIRFSAKKANNWEVAKTWDAHDSIDKEHLKLLLGKLPVSGTKKKRRCLKPSTCYGQITRKKVRDLVRYGVANGFLTPEESTTWEGICDSHWVQVASVTRGTADFYDLTVDVDHSYWSAGLISHNTLGAAILEVLAIVHMERSVAHMAAILPQAQKAQSYVKGFFQKPYLRDYVVGDNVKTMRFLRYRHKLTGDNLPQKQFEALGPSDQDDYEKKDHYVAVVTCTMAGANGEHVPFMVVDEIDVIPRQNLKAYEEAQAIPCVRDGKLPITLLISTRKFNFGKVQQEIDLALPTEEEPEGSGLQIRHWNLIDVTERCPPKRHLPNEPRVTLYWSEESLKTISETQWQALSTDTQAKYTKESNAYAGCLLKCKLFAVCRGRLVTASKPMGRGSLLKPIAFTIKAFKKASPAWAKAQLLCWKPGTEGLIYPALEPEVHILTPAQIAERILGEVAPGITGKAELLRFLQTRDIKFICGIDWGFTHNMAVVLLAVDGLNTYVVGAWSKPELDPLEKIALLTETIKPFDPAIYPDTEAPDMNKLLKKSGFHVRDWSKGPGSVRDGIETIRMKLSGISDPSLYFLADDEGVAYLFHCLSRYHWAIGPDGKPSDEPDDMIDSETPDDSCDAIRYPIMNQFRAKGKVIAAPEEQMRPVLKASIQTQVEQQESWGRQILDYVHLESEGESEAPRVTGKKGTFRFDM